MTRAPNATTKKRERVFVAVILSLGVGSEAAFNQGGLEKRRDKTKRACLKYRLNRVIQCKLYLFLYNKACFDGEKIHNGQKYKGADYAPNPKPSSVKNSFR